MKIKFHILFLFSIFLWSSSYASFPVTHASSHIKETTFQSPIENQKINKVKFKKRLKNWLKSQSEWSVASLVCGICGLIAAGIPLGICAIIFGAIGYGKGKPGVATAGMILGFFDIALLLVFVL